MVRSCHQPEVHAMFANILIQGSKLKKTLNLRLSKVVGKMRGQNHVDEAYFKPIIFI